jgi:hypothetical protein
MFSTPFLKNVSHSLTRLFSSAPSGMPVLDATIARHVKSQPLKGCGILCIQHSLETMVPVIKGLKQLGAEDIFIMGKQYSESAEVVSLLKEIPGVSYRQQSNQAALGQFIATFQRNSAFLLRDMEERITRHKDSTPPYKRILVLDHGGYATQMLPDFNTVPVVTIEKTTAGINRKDSSYLPFPRIEMATAVVKKVLESPAIAMAVTEKLSHKFLPEIHTNPLVCSVIGYGAIGIAITKHLLSLGHRVFVYDIDETRTRSLPKGAQRLMDFTPAIAYGNVIFGCTGKDISEKLDIFDYSPSQKTLVSCSSDDIEFQNLLRHIQLTKEGRLSSPTEEISYSNPVSGVIKILRGGFPVNFDNSTESVPAQYIQLTRSLLIAACVQAAECSYASQKYASLMLDSREQLIIARDFVAFLKKHASDYPGLEEFDKLFSRSDRVCLEWIIEHSGGTFDKRQDRGVELTS